MRKSHLLASALLFLFIVLPAFFSGAAETETENRVRNGSVSGPGMDAVLVIDVSGSMKQSDPDYLCRICRAAAKIVSCFQICIVEPDQRKVSIPGHGFLFELNHRIVLSGCADQIGQIALRKSRLRT